jgi:hypothetical protein
MKPLLGREEFESKKYDRITGFCEYYGIQRPEYGWHNIIPNIEYITNEEKYRVYVEWHNENATKLAYYLRSNEASKTEET